MTSKRGLFLCAFLCFASPALAESPGGTATCPAPAAVSSASLTQGKGPYPNLTWVGPALSGLDYFDVDVASNPNFDPVALSFSSSAPVGPWFVPPSPLYVRIRALHFCTDSGPAASPSMSFLLTQSWSRPSFLATALGPDPSGASVSFTVTNVGSQAGSVSFAPDLTGVVISPTSLTLAPGTTGQVDARLSNPASGFIPFTFQMRGGNLIETLGGMFCIPPSPVPAGSTSGTFTITPPELRFQETGPNGIPSPQSVRLQTGASKPIYPLFSVPADAPWLKITGSGGASATTPLDLSVRVDPSQRPAGDSSALRAVVNVWPAGSASSEPQTLQASMAPRYVVSAGSRAPSSPEPLARIAGGSFVVPTVVAASNTSFGVTYRSDLWIRNDAPSDVSVTLYYTPDGVDGVSGAGVLQTSLTVPTGTTTFLSDVVGSVFATSGSGQLELRSTGASLLSVRSTTEATTGGDLTKRFGTEIPVVSNGTGIALGGEALVAGISDDAANRSNLILAETTGASATVHVTVYDPNGNVVGTLSPDRTVPAYGKIQVDRLVAAVAPLATLSGGWASVRVVGGSGHVVALATVLDNKTNSFSAVRGRITAAAAGLTGALGDTILVPSCARLVGALSTAYTTSLSLVNGGAAIAHLSLAYFFIDKASGTSSSVVRSVTLPAHGALPPSQADDVIAALFGVANESYGWIRITGDVANVVSTVAVSSKLDPNDASKGLKTSSVDALLASDSPAYPILAFRVFPGIEKTLAKRTNLILVETAGQSGTVKVQLWDRRGLPIGSRSYPVAPFQYLQINDVVGSISTVTGIGTFQDIEAIVSTTSGFARVVSFASVIDNVSTNPEIFLLRPPGPPKYDGQP